MAEQSYKQITLEATCQNCHQQIKVNANTTRCPNCQVLLSGFHCDTCDNVTSIWTYLRNDSRCSHCYPPRACSQCGSYVFDDVVCVNCGHSDTKWLYLLAGLGLALASAILVAFWWFTIGWGMGFWGHVIVWAIVFVLATNVFLQISIWVSAMRSARAKRYIAPEDEKVAGWGFLLTGVLIVVLFVAVSVSFSSWRHTGYAQISGEYALVRTNGIVNRDSTFILYPNGRYLSPYSEDAPSGRYAYRNGVLLMSGGRVVEEDEGGRVLSNAEFDVIWDEYGFTLESRISANVQYIVHPARYERVGDAE